MCVCKCVSSGRQPIQTENPKCEDLAQQVALMRKRACMAVCVHFMIIQGGGGEYVTGPMAKKMDKCLDKSSDFDALPD